MGNKRLYLATVGVGQHVYVRFSWFTPTLLELPEGFCNLITLSPPAYRQVAALQQKRQNHLILITRG